MENFTRRVAGWLLLCLAMSVSLSASAQQPPVERSDVETVPVQDDPEEMVVESRPEDTNRSKSEKEDDTDDDEDEDEDEDDEEEECFMTNCPECEEEVYFDESVLEDGEVICPNCGAKLEFDLSDLANDEDEDQE